MTIEFVCTGAPKEDRAAKSREQEMNEVRRCMAIKTQRTNGKKRGGMGCNQCRECQEGERSSCKKQKVELGGEAKFTTRGCGEMVMI